MEEKNINYEKLKKDIIENIKNINDKDALNYLSRFVNIEVKFQTKIEKNKNTVKKLLNSYPKHKEKLKQNYGLILEDLINEYIKDEDKIKYININVTTFNKFCILLYTLDPQKYNDILKNNIKNIEHVDFFFQLMLKLDIEKYSKSKTNLKFSNNKMYSSTFIDIISENNEIKFSKYLEFKNIVNKHLNSDIINLVNIYGDDKLLLPIKLIDNQEKLNDFILNNIDHLISNISNTNIFLEHLKNIEEKEELLKLLKLIKNYNYSEKLKDIIKEKLNNNILNINDLLEINDYTILSNIKDYLKNDEIKENINKISLIYYKYGNIKNLTEKEKNYLDAVKNIINELSKKRKENTIINYLEKLEKTNKKLYDSVIYVLDDLVFKEKYSYISPNFEKLYNNISNKDEINKDSTIN